MGYTFKMASLLLRACGKQTVLASKQVAVLSKTCGPMSTVQAYEQMEQFWKKNRQLNRPLSPHLSIYKPQLTSMLSLCHRVTGIAMELAITGTAITLFMLPGDFTHYLNLVASLNIGPAILTAAKYLLAFPVSYHYINGIRHLAWDWAMGFGLKETYATGKFVFALAWIVASCFVFLF